jgi:hypothetical protein
VRRNAIDQTASVFNHAAASPEDVEDARRGCPPITLESFASERGWDFRNQELAGHFGGLNPDWVDYVFNSMRGELVPGRFGTLQHELLEVALGNDGSPSLGQWYGRRSVGGKGWRGMLGLERHVDAPFADRSAMWVPTTSVKLLVPEAAALPGLRVVSAAYSTRGEKKLGVNGPGLRITCNGELSPADQEFLDARLGPALTGLAPYVRLRLAYGALGLTVNGYVTDARHLDHLVAIAGYVATALADLARPTWQPGSFLAPLGPFDASTHPQGYPSFAIGDSSGIDALNRSAANFGWTVEDPVALHRRFPTLPLPGVSRGVIGGLVPGSGTQCRLSWQTQMPRRSSLYFRGAGLFAARPDAPRTPPGGELITATDMYVAVVDGVACAWSRSPTLGEMQSIELLPRCLETMRTTQLADV